MVARWGRYSREWERLTQQQKDIIGHNQTGDFIRISDIAKGFNLKVILTTLPAIFSGEIRPDKENPGNFLIRINREKHKNHQRFTLAHEVAHFLLHKELIKTGITDTVLYRSKLSDPIEAEANRLAADILMPPWLLEKNIIDPNIIDSDQSDLYLVAQKMGVSNEALEIKLGLR